MTRSAEGASSQGRRLRSFVLRSVVSAIGLASLAGISPASANVLKNPTIPPAPTSTGGPTNPTIPPAPTSTGGPTNPTLPGPTAPEAGPVDCNAPPSVATCKDSRYVDRCRGNRAVCTPILEAGFRAAMSGDDLERYQDLDDEAAIVDGKTQRRSMSNFDIFAAGNLTYESKEARAHALAQQSSVEPSVSYARTPEWLTTPAVNSCDEYVYEKYYDYMRFVDIANACKRDAGCVVDTAYGTITFGGVTSPLPGNIANRQLRGRATTTAAPLPEIPLTRSTIPKNAFYTGAVFLTPKVRAVLAAAYPEHKDKLDDAVARAHAGENYYRWGNAPVEGVPAIRSFANEYAFHSDLRERTRDVPVPEAIAAERRANAFVEAFATFQTETYCNNVLNVQACRDTPMLRQNGLLDMLGSDPIARAHVLASARLRNDAIALAVAGRAAHLDATGQTFQPFDRLRSGFPALPGLAQVPGGGGGFDLPNGTVSYAAPGTVGGVTPPGGGTTAPVPVNLDPKRDPSALWQRGNTMGFNLDFSWQGDPPVVDTASGKPRLDCAVEAQKSKYRLFACQATNLILDELFRDNPGCLDKGYSGCDWRPELFVSRFHKTAHFMAERTESYLKCERWTSRGFDQIPTSGKADYRALEEYMRQREAEFNAFPAPRDVDAKSTNSKGVIEERVRKFGQSTGDAVTFGDRASFAGGYRYDAGWSSTPKQRDARGNICRMDFTTDAEFVATASAFGRTKSLVDARAHLKANVNDDGAASFRRKFFFLGEDFIPDETLTFSFATPPVSKGWEEDITLFNSTYPLPFGAYVEVDVGVELSAGATFFILAGGGADGGSTSNGDCVKKNLEAVAMIIPNARASLYGSAYGSWLGILKGGLEVEVDLIKANLPIVAQGKVNVAQQKLEFDLSGRLRMKTLSGHIDVCGCFTLFCGCKEMVSWPGIDVGSVDVFQPVHAEADLTLF